MIDPVLLTETMNALAESTRGIYWRRGVRRMRENFERDTGFDFDARTHQKMVNIFAEETASRWPAGERTFIIAAIQEMGFWDFAFSVKASSNWGVC